MIPARHTAATLAALSFIGTLSLIGTLSGCATAPPADGAAAADYADGDYSATGGYVSPNGNETIDVTVTLADSVVAEVQVTSHPTNPNTELYQGQFVQGIAAQVVGKRIDELDVSKVAGSSLTSGGFNDAIEQIKADALE